jgi:glycosyltransferase involved in cell wall biosynthesis
LPLISVLIPCHNSAPWLKEAVESICRQSHRHLEILVYDDGSTDESPRILKQLAAADHRIAPMGSFPNRGIVHALNAMLHTAQGSFIARMDADDISLPERLALQLRHLETNATDLCGTWYRDFGHGIGRSVHRPYAGEREVRAELLFQSAIGHPTLLARREVFEKFQYRDDYIFAEDYDLFVRVSAQFRLANIPKILYRYRRHRQQTTRTRRAAMEAVAGKIRIEALRARGIEPSTEEQRIHNLIRAPHSIHSLEELRQIEIWLLKLLERFERPEEQRIIAAQWTRAAIRAAPLGGKMWRMLRRSRLYALQPNRPGNAVALAFLAATRLDYDSQAFDILQRFSLGG